MRCGCHDDPTDDGVRQHCPAVTWVPSHGCHHMGATHSGLKPTGQAQRRIPASAEWRPLGTEGRDPRGWRSRKGYIDVAHAPLCSERTCTSAFTCRAISVSTCLSGGGWEGCGWGCGAPPPIMPVLSTEKEAEGRPAASAASSSGVQAAAAPADPSRHLCCASALPPLPPPPPLAAASLELRCSAAGLRGWTAAAAEATAAEAAATASGGMVAAVRAAAVAAAPVKPMAPSSCGVRRHLSHLGHRAPAEK